LPLLDLMQPCQATPQLRHLIGGGWATFDFL
jgi:hypothetical protein